MFASQLRAAITAAPRVELTKFSALLWRAYGNGSITEAEAQALSDLIEAKRALPVPPPRPLRLIGSRPRTPESLTRRRRWAASGALPPALASRFTAAETAVLAVIAAEALKHGRCTLVLDHIAALAGVSRTTVKNALREARAIGLIRIEERRVSAWRNAPNVVTITSREWSAWLDKRRKAEGANSRLPCIQENKKGTSALQNRGWAAEGQGSGRDAPWRDSRQLLSMAAVWDG